MWFWWGGLLKTSGLEEYPQSFVKDRLSLLDSIDFFHDAKKELEKINK